MRRPLARLTGFAAVAYVAGTVFYALAAWSVVSDPEQRGDIARQLPEHERVRFHAHPYWFMLRRLVWWPLYLLRDLLANHFAV